MPESLIKNWDDLLEEGLVTPPADFHARVMAQVALLPVPVQPEQTWPNGLPAPTTAAVPATVFGLRGMQGVRMAAQAVALTAAALAGLTQLAIFSFGIWSATAAG
ncbi:MAG: hypothetical protein V4772_17725 [Pseudomonadota bacterium]